MHRVVAWKSLGVVALLSVCLCALQISLVAAQERVRAKVGLQVRSGDRSSPAKSNDTVKTGDFVRVYVIPEDDAYVYVVHNDGKKLTLLNAKESKTKTSKGLTVALPTPSMFYQIDGASDREAITVICSPREIPEVTTLFNATDVAPKNWLPLEKDLLEKSKIDLGQKPESSFQIAGNVRSLENDPFLDKLQIYSGKALMVKKYELQVQK